MLPHYLTMLNIMNGHYKRLKNINFSCLMVLGRKISMILFWFGIFLCKNWTHTVAPPFNFGINNPPPHTHKHTWPSSMWPNPTPGVIYNILMPLNIEPGFKIKCDILNFSSISELQFNILLQNIGPPIKNRTVFKILLLQNIEPRTFWFVISNKKGGSK